MAPEAAPWVAVLLVAAVVALTRVAGPWAVEVLRVTPALGRFLDGMAGAVIAAIVAQALVQGGPRAAAAAGAAGVAALAGGGVFGGMAAGVAAAALWRLAAG